jgi:hypothetical protein
MLHRVGGHATHSSTSVVRRIPVTTEEIQEIQRRFRIDGNDPNANAFENLTG